MRAIFEHPTTQWFPDERMLRIEADCKLTRLHKYRIQAYFKIKKLSIYLEDPRDKSLSIFHRIGNPLGHELKVAANSIADAEALVLHHLREAEKRTESFLRTLDSKTGPVFK